MYVQKMGTVVGIDSINAGDTCAIILNFGYDGMVNSTKSGVYFNYLGGDTCLISKVQSDDPSLINSDNCPDIISTLEGDWPIGSQHVIYYNKEYQGNSEQSTHDKWYKIR